MKGELIIMGEGASMIATALTNVTTVFNQAVTMITGNEIAMLFVGIPIVGAGIGLFHRLISH